MFDSWRLQIRAARTALQGGQLDKAGQLLRQTQVRDFLPAKQLSADLAEGLAQRAKQYAISGDTSAGWRDVAAATQLGCPTPSLGEARQVLIDRALAQAEAYLASDEPGLAIACLNRLEERQSPSGRVKLWRQVAHQAARSKELSRRGRLGEAVEVLECAGELMPGEPTVERLAERLRVKMKDVRDATDLLHRALAAENWTGALAAADAILQIAPDHPEGKAARERAWSAVGLGRTAPTAEPTGRRVDAAGRGRPAVRSSTHIEANAKVDTVSNSQPSERFFLWVDGVGGYLVCRGPRVVLGQPSTDAPPDVAILADLARRHAVIHFDGEGFLIEPVHAVAVDGRPASGPVALRDGAEIQLGDSLQLRFRQPHALSATARLEWMSRHKTAPHADAIVLMADSCILGPRQHSHIVCPRWPGDVVLFRQGESLLCRAAGELRIDGNACQGQGVVTSGSQVAGDDFSFSIEAI